MANLKDVIYLSNEDYETLVSTGTVTIDGQTLTYNENNIYITPDKLASTTEDGLMSATDKAKLDNLDDSNVVHKSGAETITGEKTVNNRFKIKATDTADTNGLALVNSSGNTWHLNTNQYSDLRIAYGANESSQSATYSLNTGGLSPVANNTRDLGSSGAKWKDIYLAGNLTDGTNSITVANIVAKQNALPTTTTAGKVLKSTTTAGTVEWADDNNVTYTIATGDANGQIKVTPSTGNAYNVDVKGLGAAAYKGTTTSVTSGSADLVTSGAVYDYVSGLAEPMVFKGSATITKSGSTYTITVTDPSSAADIKKGYTYKVISAPSGDTNFKVGDTLIAAQNNPGTNPQSNWTIIPSGDEPSGTVTSVALRNGSTSQGTLTISGSPITSSGTIDVTLADNYGDTKNPYASKSANYVLASPNGSNGVPSFRALVKADLPSLSASDVGITVTSSSVSDGTNTFNKYIHPTYTEQTAGLYKIGRDSTGHVVIGDAFTLPTVNNGTLTIQKNGSQVATFTANQSGDTTANIPVPTSLGELVNNVGYIKSGDILVPTSGLPFVYDGQLYDAMWSFAKRYYIIYSIHPRVVNNVTYPYTDSSKTIADDDYIVDSTPTETYNSVDHNLNSLFDGSTDTSAPTTTADKYIKIRMIPKATKDDSYSPSASTTTFPGYPYGKFALTTYWGANATSIQYATYNKHSSWPTGWAIINGTKINDQTWIVNDDGHYSRTEMDFWFIGDGNSSHNLNPTSIYWLKNRVTSIDEENSHVSKFVDETLVNKLIWKERDTQTAEIGANGVAKFKTIYENGSTLADTYLGKTSTATDSSKLNNQEASYYLNYNNFTNTPADYIAITLPADSGTLSTANKDAMIANPHKVVFVRDGYYYFPENLNSNSTWYWSCNVYYNSSTITKKVIAVTKSTGAYSKSDSDYLPGTDGIIMNNNKFIQGKDSGGTARDLIGYDAYNSICLGNSQHNIYSMTNLRAYPDNTYSLGSVEGNTKYRWKNLYLAGSISDGTNSITVEKIASTDNLGTAAAKNYTTQVTQNSTDLVTSGAVYTALDNLPEPMVFKGTLGTGGTITSLPSAAYTNEGHTYKVITAGTYESQSAKVGDVFTSTGSEWVLIPAGDDIEDTWRNIKVNGTELLGTAISSSYVNFVSGTNVTVSGSGNDITISSTDQYQGTVTSVAGQSPDSNGAVSLNASNIGAVEKVTYEYNKEISFGGTGYLKIGSFPMYDSNITIDIDSTSNVTYHATVVIATQNVTDSYIGSAHVVSVYGDATDTITSAIRVVWANGSHNYDVYFVPAGWSKNLVHIRAVALAGTPTDVCIAQEGTAPESTSGLEAVNVLKSNFYSTSNPSGYTSNIGTVTSVCSQSPDSNGAVSLTHDNIGAGPLTIGDGAYYQLFRSASGWRAGIYSHTHGDEALVFANQNPATSWIFATTNPIDRGSWYDLNPSLQIKNGKVVINKLIANGTQADYNLDVNGTANATSITINNKATMKYNTSDDCIDFIFN